MSNSRIILTPPSQPTPPHRLLLNFAKMSNSTCNPYTESTLTSPLSCVAPTAGYDPNLKATYGPSSYTNHSRLDNMNALRTCCRSEVYGYGPRIEGYCYFYCTEESEATFAETQACVKNYTSQNPEEDFTGLTCPDRSGATMLGRTGGWGGGWWC